MPKRKKIIDNRWVLDGMNAYGIIQADLARDARIEITAFNKALKNRRDISHAEAEAIKTVFARKKAQMPQIKEPLSRIAVSIDPAEQNGRDQEGKMTREGGLWEVIGDLTRRVAKLEEAKERDHEEPVRGPQKRRQR